MAVPNEAVFFRAGVSALLMAGAIGGTWALMTLCGKSLVAVGYGLVVAPMLLLAVPFALASTRHVTAGVVVVALALAGWIVWRLHPVLPDDYANPSAVISLLLTTTVLLLGRLGGRNVVIGVGVAATLASIPVWCVAASALEWLRPATPVVAPVPTMNEGGMFLMAFLALLLIAAPIAETVAALLFPILDAPERGPNETLGAEAGGVGA